MSKPVTEFIGFDLGHGESCVARALGASQKEPEILDYKGMRSFITAVAKTGKNIKIGSDAVNLMALSEAGLSQKTHIWTCFKGQDLDAADVRLPTEIFTQKLMQALTETSQIAGLEDCQFLIGCPSGWSLETRALYREIFTGSGLEHVEIIPESRAALMTAVEQGYVTPGDAQERVLVIDIGSSTTDITLCQDMWSEDIGHNQLGSGLLDTEILALNLTRQKDKKKIDKLLNAHPYYQPIMEFWCRQVKEEFFNGDGHPVHMIKRLPVGRGLLFEISLNREEADEILNKPLFALNDFTWAKAYDFALKEAEQALGGRAPKVVLLTGGASRLPLVLPATERAFPEAKVIRGAEPEFAIARGLAWLGRFETLHENFLKAVDQLLSHNGPIKAQTDRAVHELGALIAPALADGLSEACIVPSLQKWREGKIDTVEEIEHSLSETMKYWLGSEAAQTHLRPVIQDWFTRLQRRIEVQTDPLCRDHGLPAMVLSLDDSPQIARHLDELTLGAPRVTTLEHDTALIGTSLSTILLGVLLAKANLLLPLLANPVSLIFGAVLAGGGFWASKKVLEKRFERQNIPVILRQIMTNKKIRAAIEKQRPKMVSAIHEAWSKNAEDQFSAELIDTLRAALKDRADQRARLFLI